MSHGPNKSASTTFQKVNARLRSYASHLKRKGKWHWIWVIALIALGTAGEHLLDRYMVWERARYAASHYVQLLDVRPIRPRRTFLVLIGDDEYWNGELARRVPIKRDYLAKLVTALDKGEPEIIVLDFAFRSPTPQSGSQESTAYANETSCLLDAIRDVSSQRRIVIPTTFRADGPSNVREPSVLDGHNFPRGRVAEGYINLSDDMREIPLTISLKGGEVVDSLATATTRLADEKAVLEAEAKRGEGLPYGSFIDPVQFPSLKSTEVLSMDAEALKSKIGCDIVIVGGTWHRDAYGRGPQADAIPSPAGDIAGVFAQANFIEALLDSRTYKPLGHAQKIMFGVVLSLLVAITTSLPWALLVRIVIVIMLAVVPIVISYLFRQNLGIFFDFFLPVVMILAHWVIARD